MKKINLLMALVLSSLTIAMTGCSSSDNDDVSLAPLSNPTISMDATQKAANRLAFGWTKVEGATEYAYTLKDADGNLIDGGLANTLSYSNKTLLPNSAYTLSVTAYPLVGNGTSQSSETVTLQGTTDAVKIQPASDGSKISLTWLNLVDVDNVTYTAKHLQSAQKDTLTTTTSTAEYTLDKIGDYQLSLISYTAGDTEYAISDCTSDFSLRTVNGTAYLDGIGKTVDATMTMNDDGTFTISKWYEGTTDLTFQITDEGSIEIVNAYDVSSDGKYYYVYSGRSKGESDVYSVCVVKTKSYASDSKGTHVVYPTLPHGKISLKVLLSNYYNDDIDNTSTDGMFTFVW